MSKLQQIGSSLLATIPAEICRLKGWKKQDTVYFSLDSKTGKVVLDKI